MKFVYVALLLAACLLVAADAYKSVKELKPSTDEEKHLHHLLHFRHRKREDLRERTHHEEQVEKLGHPQRVLSRSYHHKVGPEYPDVHPNIGRAAYKKPARYDAQGNHIPDEILDSTYHNLHHK